MGAKWAFRRDVGHTGDFMLLLFYHQGTGYPYCTAKTSCSRSMAELLSILR